MRLFVVLFGVLLPAFALFVEATTGACADLFFDPIPTVRHGLLVGLIPVANLLLLALDDPHPRRRAWLTRLHGVALGVALVYALLFLPILPIAVIAAFFLIGFLP